VQHRTNHLAKETGTLVKDLNQVSVSRHSLEPVSMVFYDSITLTMNIARILLLVYSKRVCVFLVIFSPGGHNGLVLVLWTLSCGSPFP